MIDDAFICYKTGNANSDFNLISVVFFTFSKKKTDLCGLCWNKFSMYMNCRIRLWSLGLAPLWIALLRSDLQIKKYHRFFICTSWFSYMVDLKTSSHLNSKRSYFQMSFPFILFTYLSFSFFYLSVISLSLAFAAWKLCKDRGS